MIRLNWLVCKSGYSWEEQQGRSMLTPVQGWPNRVYEPLQEHTGMFREFGELSLLPDRREGFLGFANRYGRLLWETPESVDDWAHQSEAVQSVVVVWDSARSDDFALAAAVRSVDEYAAGHVKSKFLYDRQRRRCYHDVEPTNLIGAIWLQLADAMVNNRRYARCPAAGCGRWFARSPTGKGPCKNHCSVACKTRAYRRRKLEGT